MEQEMVRLDFKTMNIPVSQKSLPQPPKEGFVYVIEAVGMMLAKIGWSADPQVRMEGFQIGSPVELRLVHTIGLPRTFEKRLHKHFSSRHHRGEWFDFKGEDPVPLVEAAVRQLQGETVSLRDAR